MANFGLIHNRMIRGDAALTGDSADAKKWREKEFNGRTIPATDAQRQHERATRLHEALTASGVPSAQAVFRLNAPLVIGLGNAHFTEIGCLWHSTLGFPYLPGSGLKGLVRSFAKQFLDVGDHELERIFGAGGDGGAVGSVCFMDALPLAGAKLNLEVMAPHHKKYHGEAGSFPTDTGSPEVLTFLSLSEGSKLLVHLTGKPGPLADGETEEVMEWVQLALDYLGAGGKTSRQFGRMSII